MAALDGRTIERVFPELYTSSLKPIEILCDLTIGKGIAACNRTLPYTACEVHF